MAKISVRKIEDEVEPGRRMKLEEPGKPRDYDIPKEMATQMNSEFDWNSFLNDIKAKDPGMIEPSLVNFGRRFMEKLIELADTKYKDRTAEMIEKVAQTTKISFPHRFQRYLELSFLCLKPLNRYTVLKSTTKEIEIEVQGEVFQNSSVPFESMCLSMFGVISGKTGDRISVETKRSSSNGICRFTFKVNPEIREEIKKIRRTV